MARRPGGPPNDHIVRAYIAYSRLTAILAFALPVVLVLSSFHYDGGSLKDSLSAYYHGADLQRNVFVGTLCAVAAFLALYKGWRGWEAMLLNVAGISAVLVAFIPTPEDKDGFWSAHGAAALVLFGCIVAVGVVLPWVKKRLGRAKRTPPLLGYSIAAAIMIAGAALAVLGKLGKLDGPVFLLGEILLVVGFGAFWGLRTRHLSEPAIRPALLEDGEI